MQRALEAAADRLFQEARQAPDSGQITDEMTHEQRRADALGRLAECALAADLDRGTAGERYQVVVHVEAAALRSESAPSALDAGHAVIEMDDAATWVSAETAQRIACDASLVVMRHGADDSVLDVGRKTRTIPPAIRRALTARDTRCQFPGCTSRRCDAHHIRHWAMGGPTRLDNLVLLCRRHHGAVHEDGFKVVRGQDGTLTYLRPDGTRLDAAPAPPRWGRWANQEADPLSSTATRMQAAGLTIGPSTTIPIWDGQPLDLVWAIDVLRTPEVAGHAERCDSASASGRDVSAET